MVNLRILLYIAFFLVVYLLWMTWEKDHLFFTSSSYNNKSTFISTDQKNEGSSFFVQEKKMFFLKNLKYSNKYSSIYLNFLKKYSLIHIKTSVLNLYVSLKDGNIMLAELIKYPIQVGSRDSVKILDYRKNNFFAANNFLYLLRNKKLEMLKLNFSSDKIDYNLEDIKNNTFDVVLYSKIDNFLEVKKVFSFIKNSYLISVKYLIKNIGIHPLKLYVNSQLLNILPEEEHSNFFHVGSYIGASYSNIGHHFYKKISFKNMEKNNVIENFSNGWIAMQQHYFLNAWIFHNKSLSNNLTNENNNSFIYTKVINNSNIHVIGIITKNLFVYPKRNKIIFLKLYIGPKIASVLKNISPALNLTIDYGWFWFLSSLLFNLMKLINTIIGNWGWSIVLTTILIKILFYRLSKTSYRSMSSMKKLQPKLKSLRDYYGDDKNKINKLTIDLYRQEKINPFSSCLPILIQVPVFIALYWVLLESIEFRQANFIFWIKDLSVTDPYHILSIIMGLTMLFQQKLSSSSEDDFMQNIMIVFFPILFTVLFWNFPSGLLLYWSVNNIISIIQQWIFFKKYG
ncbi:membrane protein insertase YidC [Candidatus Legionella polyplacis]|uniref:Membrane protein insertase YidC n=1 Tax=Candidatus Legionella polyplacis TaxID=2005262 RepID=A0ABZ2GX90_9GAMM